MDTPAQQPTKIDAQTKAAVLMAVSQLDMLIAAFATAPTDVLESSKNLKAALERWANA